MNDELLVELMLRSGLAQYPDKKLYNAAKLLSPEERPTVPVEAVEPDPQKQPTLRLNPKLAGFATFAPHPEGVKIFKKDHYFDEDPRMLASILAHEGEHVKHAKRTKDAGGDPYDERPAYEVQRRVLQRLGASSAAIRAIEARLGKLPKP